MSDSCTIPPSLPKYEPPKEFQKAELPAAMAPSSTKPPGIMNKMISRMLKPKLKTPKPKLKTKTKFKKRKFK